MADVQWELLRCESLMGFSPGHTRLRKKNLSEDERCSMLGNSFHTTVFAGLLRACLLGKIPQLRVLTLEKVVRDFKEELQKCQKEIYTGHGKVSLLEGDDTWLDRLEQQYEAVRYPLAGKIPAEVALVMRLIEQVSFRGTDVHVDTMSFFRPDRLPRTAVDARQWKMEGSQGLEVAFSRPHQYFGNGGPVSFSALQGKDSTIVPLSFYTFG